MGEPGRIQAFLAWWRELPTAWRVNAGLYALAGLSLIALLAQIAVGGGSRPRRVEVAARAPTRPTTTFVAPSTTEPTTTTVPPPTTAPPATAAPQAPATTRARGGGGGTPSPPAANFQPTPTTAPPCRNSRDPACGQFRWDPDPGPNADLEISVNGPTTATAGQPITFTVIVADPDHAVTGNCTQVSGAQGQDYPCPPPPNCAAHGPWTPPPRHGGSKTFTFTGSYPEGTHEVAFSFRTDRDGSCPDAYGSSGSQRITVTVTPPE